MFGKKKATNGVRIQFETSNPELAERLLALVLAATHEEPPCRCGGGSGDLCCTGQEGPGHPNPLSAEKDVGS